MTVPPDPFWFRRAVGPVEFGFTDARTDLGRGTVGEDVEAVAHRLGGEPVLVRQVHGASVVPARRDAEPVEADALVVDAPGVVGVVRVADCTPVVLVGVDRAVAAVVHAGRVGMTAGVVPAAVAALRERGAEQIEAWVGPRACGSCYEVPAEMADAVAAVEPAARSTTSWGTPAVDVGAGVIAQLDRVGVEVHDLGGCTIEDERFWSHRRQGDAAGRFGVVAVVHGGAS